MTASPRPAPGRLSRLRSWPALTTSPSAAARAAVRRTPPTRRRRRRRERRRHRSRYRSRCRRRRCPAPARPPPGSGSTNRITRQPSALQRGDRRVTSGISRCRAASPPPRSEPRGVGHQRSLLGPHRARDRHQPLVRIALDVELAGRAPRPHQFDQGGHVGGADVPLVRARMHGQPIGAGIVRDAGEFAGCRARRCGASCATARSC